ncbi:hypothetical protein EA462_12095 [Natrarchaeobius halalkaliphilus]|uniref:TraB/GumN family protein n=1 Tax=Natrarchaeobius halalkaliphilus TaxID=1679091 RepID=A0A3N6LMR1_9EURY|nr:hypothetical protein [Natrarchaeobius halalkaliphilus]RQG89107.1 hypothetical protein EA462_12095 [Natrarchaeobius halalkaliphilus]
MAASPPPTLSAAFDDPRISDRFCRRLSGPAGNLILLGVVHDHPASVARVERVLESLDPDVLALELPAGALALYRAYARERDEKTGTPRFGGEMSAAIGAAPDAEVVGIDAPNWSFLRRVVTRLIADRVSPATARQVVANIGGATREVLACRVAATLTHATSMTVARNEPVEYDCSVDDPPERQAAHERAHVDTVQTLLESVDTDESALSYRDDVRERCMVDRLLECRTKGDVVAVVGVDHLERLEVDLTAQCRSVETQCQQ